MFPQLHFLLELQSKSQILFLRSCIQRTTRSRPSRSSSLRERRQTPPPVIAPIRPSSLILFCSRPTSAERSVDRNVRLFIYRQSRCVNEPNRINVTVGCISLAQRSDVCAEISIDIHLLDQSTKRTCGIGQIPRQKLAATAFDLQLTVFYGYPSTA